MKLDLSRAEKLSDILNREYKPKVVQIFKFKDVESATRYPFSCDLSDNGKNLKVQKTYDILDRGYHRVKKSRRYIWLYRITDVDWIPSTLGDWKNEDDYNYMAYEI